MNSGYAGYFEVWKASYTSAGIQNKLLTHLLNFGHDCMFYEMQGITPCESWK
ncbi:hypothetical protein APHCR_0597 [Anaplasma phagocytophilum str. CR1007]|nr:hypothetical protein APHHGE2_1414 [Anaplasma phagocytophilum str. HGE2]KJV98301.1 hypothetical protein OTSANNIE_1390 [Anaplasma phagocytophilum str. Annie]KJZ98471.1 hypothetical protein APHCR_0597 [Anaplasma phagocytophilum str. CR1007]KKA00348.1 hypothetical protein APHDU1_0399 [Anaplasma phagocytophilum]